MLLSLAALAGLFGAALSSAQPSSAAPDGHAATVVVAAAGDLIAGDVQQGEQDLLITITAPDGSALATIDAWERGRERIAVVAPGPGTYRVVIRAARPGTIAAPVQVRIDPLRPASAPDIDLAAAIRLASDGKARFDRRDASSLQASIELRLEALLAWQRLGDAEAVQMTWSGIGDAHYRLTNFDQAERAYESALALSRPRADVRSTAELLNNLGMLHWPRGNVASARSYLDESLPLWRTLKFQYGEAAALTNIGILMWEAGELDDAERHQLQALSLFRALKDRRGEAYVLTNLASVLDTINRRQDAIDYLSRSIVLFQQVGDRIAAGRSLVRRARLELAMGQPRRSLASVAAALPLVRESADRLAEGDAHETAARVRSESGDHAGARADFSRARALYQAVGSLRGESNVHQGLGTVALAEGDTTTALAELERARTLRRQIGVRSLEVETLVSLVDAARRAGQLALARAHAEDALALVNRIGATVFARERRLSYGATVQRISEDYVGVLLGLHRQAPAAGFDRLAFEAADRAKARGLIARLREFGITGAELDPRLLARERELRDEMAYVAWTIWTASDRPPVAGAPDRHARLEALARQHDEVDAAIRRADPRYAAALRPPTISLAQIQHALLDADTVLVEFMLGADASHVWVVTADETRVMSLPPRARVDAAVRAYRQSVSAASGSAVAAEHAGAALSRLLLAPVSPWLDRRRVLLVADGSLHGVPFAALPRPGTAVRIGETTDIVMLPSASAAALERAGPSPSRGEDVLVVADPVFGAADPRVARRSRPLAIDGPQRMRRLPFSRDEAAAITQAAGARRVRVAMDFEADRRVLLGRDVETFRYIHLATHAVVDETRPPLSAIVLSLVASNGQQQDGFLRLQDVYRLRLDADLVVLSACGTATGRPAAGEGLLSLARGALYAGARQVMVSLWDVDDAATAVLMSEFYRHLFQAGLEPAAALRGAQAAVRRQPRFAHPYYWAGWVIQGADR